MLSIVAKFDDGFEARFSILLIFKYAVSIDSDGNVTIQCKIDFK